MIDNVKSWWYVRRLKKSVARREMIQRMRAEIIILLEVKWQLEQDAAKERLRDSPTT